MLRRSAFTIIELLVVIVIIGVLTAAAVANFTVAQRRSRDNSRKTQVNAISNAVEAYYATNQKFPGLYQNIAPQQVDESTNNDKYQNCQTLDKNTTPSTFVYFYYPLSLVSVGASGVNQIPCNDSTSRPILAVSGKTLYNPDDYSPVPTWIPGLGSFLNPPAIDKRYQGADGTSTGAFVDPALAINPINSSTNQTQTYVYRKLNGGYAIYTRLENSGDSDTIVIPSSAPRSVTFPDAPAFPFPITNTNIYMLRK